MRPFAPDATVALPWWLLGAAIVLATVGVLHHDRQDEVARQSAQLEAVAELRAAQVGGWLNGRLTQARQASGSAAWAVLYRRWRDSGDTSARDQLMEHVADLRKAFGDRASMLVDERGEVVTAEPGSDGPTAPALRAASLRAMAGGTVAHSDFYGAGPAPGRTWIDLVAPLPANAAPAKAAVAFRVDPQQSLLPLLKDWPVHSRTAATVLVQRNGDPLTEAFGQASVPLASSGTLAARAVRGELPFGQVGKGLDFRGTPVLGVVRPVPGTDWLLVAKVDLDEVRDGSLPDAAWTAAAGALALLGAAAAFVRRDRPARRAARAEQAAQDDRVRSLALVQTIAESSSDAIFAKDRTGHYLLCNREAARLIGKPTDLILGSDDRALFPAEQDAAIMANDARVMADNGLATYEEELSTRDGTVTFLATKGPLRDEAGQVVGLFGISRNITERKGAEAALQQSKATMRTLLASMLDGMFVAQDHRFVFANAALPGMLDYEAADFVGRPFAEVIAPEFLDLWTRRFDQRVAGGPEPLGHYEIQFLRRGGERVWVALRASRLTYHGRPAVLGVIRDVGEQKRSADELDRHRHRLQDLVDERTRQLQQANVELA